jgi:hypothetical protein
MKICFILIALCAASLSSTAVAEANRGESLLEDCNAALKLYDAPDSVPSLETEAMGMHCMGFISGLRDGLDFWRASTEASKKRDMSSAPICIPQDATTLQLVRIVVKYLRDNPKELNKHDAILVLTALHDAYPCPTQ